MSLVKRSPLTNHRDKNPHGVVRYISKKGISVTFDQNSRPVGLATGQPDVNRASKEVVGSDRAKFGAGKGIDRSSVYKTNNSGASNGTGKPRSRTAK